MSEKITLINKRVTPFTINYPDILSDGKVRPQYSFPEARNGKLIKREIPMEVFEWLKNATSTFSQGFLEIEETDENKEEVEEIIDENKKISKSILTDKEIEEMINSGNHLSFKKKLNDLVKDLDENDIEAINSVKSYIWNACLNIGIDSTAKIKILCEWANKEYDNVKDLFDEE